MPEFNVFKHQVLIREYHLDTFGHVNNATYLALLEDARWEFLNDNGFSLQTIHQLGIGPVILECHIKFLKEITLRQTIVIESQVLAYKNKVGVMEQVIFNEQHEPCSRAKITFGFFDMKARQLILPSDEWLRAIGAIERS